MDVGLERETERVEEIGERKIKGWRKKEREVKKEFGENRCEERKKEDQRRMSERKDERKQN